MNTLTVLSCVVAYALVVFGAWLLCAAAKRGDKR